MGELVKMNKSTRVVLAIISLLFATTSLIVNAATYNLTSGSYPPCNTSWNVTGTTYTCVGNGRVTLASGDILTSNTTITISANDGIILSNNTIGSAANRINLTASYGPIQSGNTNTIYGNITGGSSSVTLINTTLVGSISTGGAINLTGGSVSGSVNSSSNAVTTTNTVISGAVTALGNINMTGGSVAGLVTSVGNTITTNGTNLSGGATAQSGMTISGGTLAGNFVMNQNNPIVLAGVNMTSGSISGASTVTIQGGSTLGSGSSSITISSTSGAITVNASTVYGSLTAPGYSTVNIINGGAVYGTCTPNSTPANACNNTATLVDHYRISHSGSGITCAAEAITIRAYNNLGNLVNPPNGTIITLTTVPASGTWSGGNSVTFNGSTDTVVKFLRQTTAATININVTDGAKTEIAAHDPNITFVNAGLQFSRDASFNPINTQIAGVTNNNFILRAIRTDNSTGACVAQTTGNRSVNLAYECRNPVSCIAGQTLRLNGIAVAANNNNAAINYQAVSLNFNGAGIASIPFSYSDVGLIRLHAQLILTASGNDPAITLTGSSVEFVVKPHTLATHAITNLANTNSPQTTNSGAGFIAAGEKFKVLVQARNSAGAVTPNFGNEVVPERNNLVLTASTLVYPTGGTPTPLVNTGSFTATTTTGTFVNADIQWNQVGSIRISPRLGDSDYLSAGDISISSDGNIVAGRFYPEHYFLVAGSTATNSCSTFTYMADPKITLNYLLQARTAAGIVLTNYDNNDQTQFYSATMATPLYSAENANSGNGDATFNARVSVPGANWNDGVMTVNTTAASFARQAVTGIPDGPYSSLQLGVGITDTFDSRSLSGLTMNSSTTGICAGAGCNAIPIGSTLDVRYGRLRLDDAFGPETANLPVDFVTEYWLANRFVPNLNDNCTTILRSAVTYPAGNILTPANLTVGLSGGSTTGNYGALSAAEIAFASGDASHFFSAPTGGGTGSFNVTVDLTSYPWLRFDWNQDGSYTDASLPQAQFGFGSYRGHDRVIYWRELFN